MKKGLILSFLIVFLGYAHGFSQLRITLNPVPAVSGGVITVPVSIQNISNCGAFTAFFSL